MLQNTMFSPHMLQRVKASGLLAVLELERAEDAIAVTDALLEGGVSAIELTLRTEAAIDSIRVIATRRPEMTIGVGTILFSGQISSIVEAGAHFGVSPGCNPLIIDEAKEAQFPFSPGIATPSELEMALSKGCTLLKLFPAEPLGGVSYLKSMNNPYAYLHISYIPLGGIRKENLSSWASMKEVVALGGTWISPRSTINEKNWRAITAEATQAKAIWDEVKSNL